MKKLVSFLAAAACVCGLSLFLWVPDAFGQQFYSDNQWTAPLGLGTGVAYVKPSYRFGARWVSKGMRHIQKFLLQLKH